MWRNELKSFITERQGGTAAVNARRIYVAADGTKDLVSVDLTPVFTHSERMAQSLAALQQETSVLAASGTWPFRLILKVTWQLTFAAL